MRGNNTEADKRLRRLVENPVTTLEEKEAAKADLEEAFAEIDQGIAAIHEGPTFDEKRTTELLARLAKLIESS